MRLACSSAQVFDCTMETTYRKLETFLTWLTSLRFHTVDAATLDNRMRAYCSQAAQCGQGVAVFPII